MKLLDVLRKLGILRFGSYKGVYTDARDMPAGMLMDDVYDEKKDLVQREDIDRLRPSANAREQAPQGSEQMAARGPEPTPAQEAARGPEPTPAQEAARGQEPTPQPPASRTSIRSAGRLVFFGIALCIAALMVLLHFGAAGLAILSLVNRTLWAGYALFAKRYAMDGRHGPISAFGLLFVTLFASFMLLGLSDATTETASAFGIDIGELVLARKDGANEFVAVPDGRFPRGETVYFVLRQVGPFRADPAGEQVFDLDLEVEAPGGETVVRVEGLLGEGGRMQSADGMVPQVFAYYESRIEDLPGAYSVHVNVYDKVGVGRASRRKSFELQ